MSITLFSEARFPSLHIAFDYFIDANTTPGYRNQGILTHNLPQRLLREHIRQDKDPAVLELELACQPHRIGSFICSGVKDHDIARELEGACNILRSPIGEQGRMICMADSRTSSWAAFFPLRARDAERSSNT